MAVDLRPTSQFGSAEFAVYWWSPSLPNTASQLPRGREHLANSLAWQDICYYLGVWVF